MKTIIRIIYCMILSTILSTAVFPGSSNASIEFKDVFSISGEFKGTAYMMKFPRLVTDRYMYFVGTNKDDDVVLQKKSYKLIFK